jgi:hypothetical protein
MALSRHCIEHTLSAKSHHALRRGNGILPLHSRSGSQNPRCGSPPSLRLLPSGFLVEGCSQRRLEICRHHEQALAFFNYA